MWLGVDLINLMTLLMVNVTLIVAFFDSGADLTNMVTNLWSRHSCYPVDFPKGSSQ